MAFSDRYTARGKTQQDTWVSYGVLLTDEEEVSEPVACFCIQRRSLESAVVVGPRLEVTTTPTWADGVSSRSSLRDALLNAHEDKVGEDGWVGAPAEDCTDNGAGEIACQRMLKKYLDLGD